MGKDTSKEDTSKEDEGSGYGINPNFVPADLPRGVNPNFVPADLPRFRCPEVLFQPILTGPNFVPADLPRFRCREVMGCRRRNSKPIFVMGCRRRNSKPIFVMGNRAPSGPLSTATMTSWMKKVSDNRLVVDPIEPVTSLFGIMKNNDDTC